MTDGICPFAEWRPTKNHGYGARTGQNRPLFIVSHIMSGYKRTMDDISWLDSSGISSNFSIGDDGSISQYVNIFNASYANGITGYTPGTPRIDRTNRHIAAIEKEPGARWQMVTVGGIQYWNLVGDVGGGVTGSLFNCRSVTIEDEGFSGQPWPRPKVEASIRLHQWIIEECAGVGRPLEVDEDLLVGHHQLDPIHRAGCPGSGWPKAEILSRLQEEDMYNQHDVWALKDLEVAPGQRFPVNAREVFGVPKQAKRIDLELFSKSGYGVVLHGDTQSQAGRCGWSRTPATSDGYETVRSVCLDDDGQFFIWSEDTKSPVNFYVVHCGAWY